MSDPRNGETHWVKLWIQRTRGDTAHLSAQAFGAYMRVVLEQVRRQAPVPDDAKLLRDITGVRSHWQRTYAELLTVLERRDGGLSDPYVEKFIADFNQRSQRNRRKVRQRWRVIGGGIEDADR